MDKVINFIEKIDVVKGWKAVSGAVIFFISAWSGYNGYDINIEAIGASLMQIANGFGAMLFAIGVVLKAVRDIRSNVKK